jgi:hypothetical protein
MASVEDDRDQGFPAEWARSHLPSYGPDWDRAIDFGIDVTLLLENLELTPAERLRRLQQVSDFHALLREARRVDE